MSLRLVSRKPLRFLECQKRWYSHIIRYYGINKYQVELQVQCPLGTAASRNCNTYMGKWNLIRYSGLELLLPFQYFILPYHVRPPINIKMINSFLKMICTSKNQVSTSHLMRENRYLSKFGLTEKIQRMSIDIDRNMAVSSIGFVIFEKVGLK